MNAGYTLDDLNSDLRRLCEWAPEVLREGNDPDAIREVLRTRIRVNENIERIDDIGAFLESVEADKACAPYQEALLLIPTSEAQEMGLVNPSAWFGIHARTVNPVSE
jgi:hypothetical protein